MKKTCEMKMTVAKSDSWVFPGARRKLVMCSVFLLVSLFAGTQASAVTNNVSTLAALNSAISAAASNDVLVLADGTYTDNITLTIGKSGVTVRPATLGGAYLNNIAVINITGNNITFSGFQFTSRVSTNGTIIFVPGSRNLLTQLNFDGYNAEKYINLQGQYNEVAYCNFRNKPVTAQQGNLIHTALSPGVPGYSKIRYNSFQDMPGGGGDNGNECIRLENGAQSLYIGRTVVEFNYFNNTGPGDSEVISVKCRENVIRYNTMTNNLSGNFCFRNGDSNIAYGNFFINSGGIRVKWANDIYCYDNYFEKCGDGAITAPVLYVYDTTSPELGTNVLRNINFFHNTFVGGTSIDLDTGATAHTWANNIFSNTSANIFKGATNGIKWAGNQYSGTPGVTIPSGMTKTNSLLVRNSTGYYVPASNSPAIDKASTNYPAILDIANVEDDPSLLLDISGLPRPAATILKDVGCSEYTTGTAFNHPLALTDVGPSYLGGPSSAVNVAPSVNLFAPTNGAVFAAPATIAMSANVVDPDGTITTVGFYSGTNLLGSDTTAPYAYTWANVAAGSYNLTARATDNSGAVSTSTVVAVTSWLPPPGDNFDLSHWKLQLPTSNGLLTGASGSVDEIEAAELTNGYTSDYFYTAANGAMVFWAPNNGARTAGSSFPRSELREQLYPGSNTVWTVYGTHIMTATLRVTQVSPDAGKVVIGQMKGGYKIDGTAGTNCEHTLVFDLDFADSSKNKIYANIAPDGDNGDDGFSYTFISGSGVALSNTISYTMSMVDGLLKISVNGVTNSWDLFSGIEYAPSTDPGLLATNWDRASSNALYFKAGSYNQTNGLTADQGARVEFSSLTRYHSANITNQPDSVTNAAGSDAIFTVGASGNGTLGYQWQFNGNNLAGKTSATLTLSSVATNNAGNYTVVVSDNTSSFSAITSAVATLTVLTNFTTAVNFAAPGVSNWTCPAGVTSVQVECWGGGGAGGSAQRISSIAQCGGGGAGGAYAKYVSYPVVPGNTYTINVGTGGINNASINDTTVSGGDSWFNTNNSPSTIIIAKGGSGGESAVGSTTTTGYGLGGIGTTDGSAGNVVYAGGSGGTPSTANFGGSGGGSGGVGTNGNSGSATSGIGAIAVTGGGPGGDANATSGSSGSGQMPDSPPGGGGGGARANSSTMRAGGTGSVGRVVLTYVEARYTLTVNSGSGNGSYTNGQRVAISANAPANGKTFYRWIGDTQYVNNVTYTNALVTMSTNAVTLTATYVDAYYALTVNSGSGDGSYTNGTKVAILADEISGKAFDRWIGDITYLNTVYTNALVTMPAQAVTLTATYVDLYYALTVTGGTGSGSYTNGRQVAISADAPAAGKAFSQWAGDTQYVNNVTYTNALVTMSTNAVSLTATYVDVLYTLTVTGGSGGGSYTNGRQVAISASNLTGKAFVQWIGNTQYVNNVTYTNALVTMSTNAVSLTATYVDVLYTLTVTGGSGSGSSYTNAQVVDISADVPTTGMTFDKWTGDTQYVAGVSSSNTTVTMPAQAVALSATYKNLPGHYTLTVSNGNGSGAYTNAAQVTITAVAPEGTAFDRWIGDTQTVAGVFSLSTIVTMPAQDVALTAICENASNGVASVTWASSFIYYEPTWDSLLGPAGSGKSTIAQLMYSPDDIKDSILPGGAGAVNDVVWDTITLTEGVDDEYGAFSASTVRAGTNGYVYALIFQDNIVQAGDLYVAGPLAALVDGAADVNTCADPGNGEAINGVNSAQVVGGDPTYVLTVNSGNGSGSYTNGQQVAISADTPLEGQVFDKWTGDTQYVNNVTYTNALVTMSTNAVNLTATYADVLYALTVNSGSGSGSYTNTQVVAIAASAPASGKVFDKWIGDTAYVANSNSASTTVTMPAQAIALTATYKDVTYALTVASGSGSGSYTNAQVVAISASAPAAGLTFDKWIGDTQVVNNVTYTNALVTMPAQAVALSATYKNLPGWYTLTVSNGTGGGIYTNGARVTVTATAPNGTVFDRWTGATQIVDGVFSLSTIVTMPAQDAALTATCVGVSNGTVKVAWTATMGFYFSADPNTGILGPVSSGKSTIAQLMYSPDNAKDNILPGRAGAVNDVVWDTITLTEAGGESQWAVLDDSTVRTWTNGYVYALIFQDNNVQSGDWYFSTPLLPLVMATNIFPQSIEMNTDMFLGDAIDGVYGARVIEPIVLTVNSGNGSGTYTNGQKVAISANAPASGKVFDKWTGDTQVVNNVTYTNALVTLSSNAVSLTATYKDITYTLTVNSGTGTGSSYTNGQQVAIAANAPASGKVFDKWTGATQYVASASSSSSTVTIPTSNITLTATYADINYTLTVNSGSGSGSYTNGQQVAIAASNAPSGQVFDKWTGDTAYVANSNSVSTTVTMPASNIAVLATYKSASVTLTASAGAGGTISPTNASVLPGNSTNFVITASNYYRISTLTTNGASAGVTFNNISTNYTFVWSNVTASGTVTVSFVQQITTNAPAQVPYEWLASYFVTNDYNAAANADQDLDGLTSWQEYIAGTVPTNKASVFAVAQSNRNVVTWSPVTGRIYSVYWTTNLVKGFTNLNNNIPYPQSGYTNATPDPRVNHYQLKVRMQ